MGFTLAWVVVAVVGWVVLQLGCVFCSGENKLKLEVVRHCVPESAQLSRTHVFYRGCTIELLCYYKPCSKETPSDLVVSRMYDREITNMEERTRTNCTLMVKLRNMTDSSAGVYTCRDNYNRLNPAKPLEFKAPHLQVKVKEMCLHHQHTLNEKPTVLYYYVGCSIRLMCGYVPCVDTTHTNLTITTMRGENQTRRPVEWSRSKCSVEVEFGNMTAALAGAYRCQDTVSQLQATPLILKPTRWEFTIEEPCILDPERVRRSRDVHYFYAGCSIKLLCRYNPCLDNITSNLEVYFTGTRHDTPTSSIVLTNRTNCLLEVELRNMTDKFAGDYVCQDTISHHKPPPLTLKVSHLGLWICQDCPHDTDRETWQRTLTAYVHVGSSIKLSCKYDQESYCNNDQLQYPNLTISHPSDVTINGTKNTKCSLEVEIQKVTTASHEGSYSCEDTARGENTDRLHLRVGVPPVKPHNLTVVFRPKRSLILLVDKVKDGSDNTVWKVEYRWRGHTKMMCRKRRSEWTEDSGTSVACHLSLRKKYDGYGQYGEKLGSIFNKVHFFVTGNNVFGSCEAHKSFYIPHWVNPGRLHRVSVEKSGPTWIQLRIKFPRGIDRFTCDAMGEDVSTTLHIEYVVTNFPEEKQHLIHNGTKRFHDKYGFYRNLFDDKAAQNSSEVHTGVSLWPRTCEEYTFVNITGLRPFTFYNFTLRPVGRYKGQTYKLNHTTSQVAPMESPKLDMSFYTCVPSGSPEACVTCIVYFREIPRPVRGGVIRTYILNGTLEPRPTDEKACESECANADGFHVTTEMEESNTLVVPSLTLQSVYTVQLTAVNDEGASPVTRQHLTAIPASGPSVWVEKENEQYIVQWEVSPTDGGRGKNGRTSGRKYFAHYCLATALEALNTSNKLQCQTNMVSTQATLGSGEKYCSGAFMIGNTSKLSLTFFMSSEIQDGTSPLMEAKCRFGRNKVPETPDIRHVIPGKTELRVSYLPAPSCGDNFMFGRPAKVRVAISEDIENCDSNCRLPPTERKELDYTHHDFVPQTITLSNLMADTPYCIGVLAENDRHISDWRCKIGTTENDAGSRNEESRIVVVVLMILGLCGFAACCTKWLYSRIRKLRRRFNVVITVPEPMGNSRNRSPSPPVPLPCNRREASTRPVHSVRVIVDIFNDPVTGCQDHVAHPTVKLSSGSRHSLYDPETEAARVSNRYTLSQDDEKDKVKGVQTVGDNRYTLAISQDDEKDKVKDVQTLSDRGPCVKDVQTLSDRGPCVKDVQTLSDRGPHMKDVQTLSDGDPHMKDVQTLSDRGAHVKDVQTLSDRGPCVKDVQTLSDGDPHMKDVQTLSDIGPDVKDVQTLSDRDPHMKDVQTLSDRGAHVKDVQTLSDRGPCVKDVQTLSDGDPHMKDVQTLSDIGPDVKDVQTLSDRGTHVKDMQTLSDRGPDVKDVQTLSDRGTHVKDVQTLSDRGPCVKDVQTLSDGDPHMKDVQTLSDIGPDVKDVQTLSDRGTHVKDVQTLSDRGPDVKDVQTLSDRGLRVKDVRTLSDRGPDLKDVQTLSDRGPDVKDVQTLSDRGTDVKDVQTLSDRGTHVKDVQTLSDRGPCVKDVQTHSTVGDGLEEPRVDVRDNMSDMKEEDISEKVREVDMRKEDISENKDKDGKMDARVGGEEDDDTDGQQTEEEEEQTEDEEEQTEEEKEQTDEEEQDTVSETQEDEQFVLGVVDLVNESVQDDGLRDILIASAGCSLPPLTPRCGLKSESRDSTWKPSAYSKTTITEFVKDTPSE